MCADYYDAIEEILVRRCLFHMIDFDKLSQLINRTMKQTSPYSILEKAFRLSWRVHSSSAPDA